MSHAHSIHLTGAKLLFGTGRECELSRSSDYKILSLLSFVPAIYLRSDDYTYFGCE